MCWLFPESQIKRIRNDWAAWSGLHCTSILCVYHLTVQLPWTLFDYGYMYRRESKGCMLNTAFPTSKYRVVPDLHAGQQYKLYATPQNGCKLFPCCLSARREYGKVLHLSAKQLFSHGSSGIMSLDSTPSLSLKLRAQSTLKLISDLPTS